MMEMMIYTTSALVDDIIFRQRMYIFHVSLKVY